MAEMLFDRTYWPKSGTIIDSAIPNDLNDLWDTHGDQLSVLVAEALLANPPRTILKIGEGKVGIETFMFDVGGDVVTSYDELDHLIMEFGECSQILHQNGVDELLREIDALERLEQTIAKTKSHLRGLITDWQGRT